jgi:hypothetical protein
LLGVCMFVDSISDQLAIESTTAKAQ